jgi:hypothetical protein
VNVRPIAEAVLLIEGIWALAAVQKIPAVAMTDSPDLNKNDRTEITPLI